MTGTPLKAAVKARLLVKICGLSTPESVDCAVEAGADMLGFVFHPKSPRFVSVETAGALIRRVDSRAGSVALVVGADDGLLSAILSGAAPDLWQFHGQETLERVRDTRAVFGLPVMKAVGVASAADLAAIPAYATVADRILLDAKPPEDAAYPGGHGRVFDWRVLSALPPGVPFMLSGGLSPDNVAGAVRVIRAMGLTLTGVDVSSGVEARPGVKDLGKIRAFIAAAREVDGV